MCSLDHVYQEGIRELTKKFRFLGSIPKVPNQNPAGPKILDFQVFSMILKYPKVWKFLRVKGKNAHPFGASSVVGRITAPQRCPCPNLWNLWMS